LTQGKVALLALGVFLILGGDKGQIEKRLLAFRWGDVMLLPYLAGIVLIPLKARAIGNFFHGYMYIMVIYAVSSGCWFRPDVVNHAPAAPADNLDSSCWASA